MDDSTIQQPSFGNEGFESKCENTILVTRLKQLQVSAGFLSFTYIISLIVCIQFSWGVPEVDASSAVFFFLIPALVIVLFGACCFVQGYVFEKNRRKLTFLLSLACAVYCMEFFLWFQFFALKTSSFQDVTVMKIFFFQEIVIYFFSGLYLSQVVISSIIGNTLFLQWSINHSSFSLIQQALIVVLLIICNIVGGYFNVIALRMLKNNFRLHALFTRERDVVNGVLRQSLPSEMYLTLKKGRSLNVQLTQVTAVCMHLGNLSGILSSIGSIQTTWLLNEIYRVSQDCAQENGLELVSVSSDEILFVAGWPETPGCSVKESLRLIASLRAIVHSLLSQIFVAVNPQIDFLGLTAAHRIIRQHAFSPPSPSPSTSSAPHLHRRPYLHSQSQPLFTSASPHASTALKDLIPSSHSPNHFLCPAHTSLPSILRHMSPSPTLSTSQPFSPLPLAPIKCPHSSFSRNDISCPAQYSFTTSSQPARAFRAQHRPPSKSRSKSSSHLESPLSSPPLSGCPFQSVSPFRKRSSSFRRSVSPYPPMKSHDHMPQTSLPSLGRVVPPSHGSATLSARTSTPFADPPHHLHPLSSPLSVRVSSLADNGEGRKERRRGGKSGRWRSHSDSALRSLPARRFRAHPPALESVASSSCLSALDISLQKRSSSPYSKRSPPARAEGRRETESTPWGNGVGDEGGTSSPTHSEKTRSPSSNHLSHFPSPFPSPSAMLDVAAAEVEGEGSNHPVLITAVSFGVHTAELTSGAIASSTIQPAWVGPCLEGARLMALHAPPGSVQLSVDSVIKLSTGPFPPNTRVCTHPCRLQRAFPLSPAFFPLDTPFPDPFSSPTAVFNPSWSSFASQLIHKSSPAVRNAEPMHSCSCEFSTAAHSHPPTPSSTPLECFASSPRPKPSSQLHQFVTLGATASAMDVDWGEDDVVGWEGQGDEEGEGKGEEERVGEKGGKDNVDVEENAPLDHSVADTPSHVEESSAAGLAKAPVLCRSQRKPRANSVVERFYCAYAVEPSPATRLRSLSHSVMGSEKDCPNAHPPPRLLPHKDPTLRSGSMCPTTFASPLERGLSHSQSENLPLRRQASTPCPKVRRHSGLTTTLPSSHDSTFPYSQNLDMTEGAQLKVAVSLHNTAPSHSSSAASTDPTPAYPLSAQASVTSDRSSDIPLPPKPSRYHDSHACVAVKGESFCDDAATDEPPDPYPPTLLDCYVEQDSLHTPLLFYLPDPGATECSESSTSELGNSQTSTSLSTPLASTVSSAQPFAPLNPKLVHHAPNPSPTVFVTSSNPADMGSVSHTFESDGDQNGVFGKPAAPHTSIPPAEPKPESTQPQLQDGAALWVSRWVMAAHALLSSHSFKLYEMPVTAAAGVTPARAVDPLKTSGPTSPTPTPTTSLSSLAPAPSPAHPTLASIIPTLSPLPELQCKRPVERVLRTEAGSRNSNVDSRDFVSERIKLITPTGCTLPLQWPMVYLPAICQSPYARRVRSMPACNLVPFYLAMVLASFAFLILAVSVAVVLGFWETVCCFLHFIFASLLAWWLHRLTSASHPLAENVFSDASDPSDYIALSSCLPFWYPHVATFACIVWFFLALLPHFFSLNLSSLHMLFLHIFPLLFVYPFVMLPRQHTLFITGLFIVGSVVDGVVGHNPPYEIVVYIIVALIVGNLSLRYTQLVLYQLVGHNVVVSERRTLLQVLSHALTPMLAYKVLHFDQKVPVGSLKHVLFPEYVSRLHTLQASQPLLVLYVQDPILYVHSQSTPTEYITFLSVFHKVTDQLSRLLGLCVTPASEGSIFVVQYVPELYRNHEHFLKSPTSPSVFSVADPSSKIPPPPAPAAFPTQNCQGTHVDEPASERMVNLLVSFVFLLTQVLSGLTDSNPRVLAALVTGHCHTIALTSGRPHVLFVGEAFTKALKIISLSAKISGYPHPRDPPKSSTASPFSASAQPSCNVSPRSDLPFSALSRGIISDGDGVGSCQSNAAATPELPSTCPSVCESTSDNMKYSSCLASDSHFPVRPVPFQQPFTLFQGRHYPSSPCGCAVFPFLNVLNELRELNQRSEHPQPSANNFSPCATTESDFKDMIDDNTPRTLAPSSGAPTPATGPTNVSCHRPLSHYPSQCSLASSSSLGQNYFGDDDCTSVSTYSPHTNSTNSLRRSLEALPSSHVSHLQQQQQLPLHFPLTEDTELNALADHARPRQGPAFSSPTRPFALAPLATHSPTPPHLPPYAPTDECEIGECEGKEHDNISSLHISEVRRSSLGPSFTENNEVPLVEKNDVPCRFYTPQPQPSVLLRWKDPAMGQDGRKIEEGNTTSLLKRHASQPLECMRAPIPSHHSPTPSSNHSSFHHPQSVRPHRANKGGTGLLMNQRESQVFPRTDSLGLGSSSSPKPRLVNERMEPSHPLQQWSYPEGGFQLHVCSRTLPLLKGALQKECLSCRLSHSQGDYFCLSAGPACRFETYLPSFRQYCQHLGPTRSCTSPTPCTPSPASPFPATMPFTVLEARVASLTGLEVLRSVLVDPQLWAPTVAAHSRNVDVPPYVTRMFGNHSYFTGPFGQVILLPQNLHPVCSQPGTARFGSEDSSPPS